MSVSVFSYFVKVQVQLALERVYPLYKCNVFRQIVLWGRHSVEKECVLGSFPDVRSRES